jgi:hypothetical protein
MAFKKVYDCRILISEIEKLPSLYDCSMKEYIDKIFKDRLWGEVCEAVEPIGQPRETWKR